MSFLSILGKGLGFVPLPGASTVGKILEGVGDASSILGGAAKNASAGNLTRDRNAIDLWRSQQDAQLARDKFAEVAPGQRLSTSLRSSLLSNYQPTKTTWAGPGSGLNPGGGYSTTGGYSAGLANLDPRTKALADLLMTDELGAQQRGGVSGGGSDRALSAMPQLGQTSTADKILGGSAFGSSLLQGILKGAAARRKPSILKGNSGVDNEYP